MSFLISSAVLASAAALPKEEPRPPLTASAPWTVHAEESLCALSRKFGTAEAEIEVGFQPIFTTQSMEVLVLSRDKSDEQHIGKAKLRFAPSGEVLNASYFSVATGKKGQRYTRITVASGAFELLQSSTEMSISASPVAATIRIPATTKAIAAFRKCEDDLLRAWGVDPTTVTQERSAKPLNPARAFSEDNFPPEAVNKGFIGRVVALIQVDAAGQPTTCRVVSGVAAPLNDATCKGAMRVKYQPGTDASGRPAASIAVLPVRWQR